MTGVKFCNRRDLLKNILVVLEKLNTKVYHHQLDTLKSVFVAEVEIIQKLLMADKFMSKWR